MKIENEELLSIFNDIKFYGTKMTLGFMRLIYHDEYYDGFYMNDHTSFIHKILYM